MRPGTIVHYTPFIPGAAEAPPIVGMVLDAEEGGRVLRVRWANGVTGQVLRSAVGALT